VAIEREGTKWRTHFREAHGKGGLREPVHGEHRIARELRGCEACEELVAELDRDRLRAVENETHRGEVETCNLAIPQHLEVVLVAEIRRAEDGRAHARGEGEPQQRPADEELGRHQVRVHAVREHDDVEADQPHVVRERHPRETDVVLVEARRLGTAADVGENVAVGEHHPLRVAGGAGGELDEGDVIGADALHAAGA